jgi:hypothetical protein
MIPDTLKELNHEGFARQRRAAVLEDEIAVLATHIHAATYRLIAKLRVFDELQGWTGWPSAAHWLQWRCGFSLNAAREKFRVARALPRLPLIRASFRTGELSFAQVRAVTRIATPENEPTLLMWARHSTASHMEKLARLYRRYGENAAAMAQHRERSLTHCEEDDGMVSFRIRLPADQAAVVLKAIEAAKASLDGTDAEDLHADRSPSLDDDPPNHPDEDVSAETRQARTADAFVRVVESYLEPDERPRSTAEKYQVHVHLDLRQDADGPVYDPDAPALAEETLRRLGCEAGLVPVLHDGDEILSVGRRTRAVPPAIRRALATCCRSSSWWWPSRPCCCASGPRAAWAWRSAWDRRPGRRAVPAGARAEHLSGGQAAGQPVRPPRLHAAADGLRLRHRLLGGGGRARPDRRGRAGLRDQRRAHRRPDPAADRGRLGGPGDGTGGIPRDPRPPPPLVHDRRLRDWWCW